MDISSNLVAKAYEANRPATAPNPTTEGGNAFGQAAAGFIETLQQSEQTSMSAMSGGADPHVGDADRCAVAHQCCGFPVWCFRSGFS